MDAGRSLQGVHRSRISPILGWSLTKRVLCSKEIRRRLRRTMRHRAGALRQHGGEGLTGISPRHRTGGVEVPLQQKELIEKLKAAGEDSELNLEASLETNHADIAAKPAWIKCKLDWAKPSATKDPALTMGLTFQKLAENTRKQIRDYIVEEFVKSYGKTDRNKASAG